MRKLLPKRMRLGYSTRTTVEEHTETPNSFFNNSKPNQSRSFFFQVVRILLDKIVLVSVGKEQ